MCPESWLKSPPARAPQRSRTSIRRRAQAGKWLALLIEKVATRFGVTISSKFAAQAVPVIGAVTGATINTLFTRFYQDMARGHFIVKRLEARYGFDEVRAAYTALSQSRPRTH